MVSEIKHPIWSWVIAEEDGRSDLCSITHSKISALIESISRIVISHGSRIQNLILDFFQISGSVFPHKVSHKPWDSKVSDLDIVARINEKL